MEDMFFKYKYIHCIDDNNNNNNNNNRPHTMNDG